MKFCINCRNVHAGACLRPVQPSTPVLPYLTERDREWVLALTWEVSVDDVCPPADNTSVYDDDSEGGGETVSVKR